MAVTRRRRPKRAHQAPSRPPLRTVWACVHHTVAETIDDVARDKGWSRSRVLAEMIYEWIGVTPKRRTR